MVDDRHILDRTGSAIRKGSAERDTAPERDGQIETAASLYDIMPLDHAVLSPYARIRVALEQAGTPIGPLETLISAHALALDLTLVTDNVREFSRVPDLRVENWLD